MLKKDSADRKLRVQIGGTTIRNSAKPIKV
jgi:hypothetical protein